MVAKMIRTLVFSPAKNVFSVISIFCCSVSVGNISSHFQTFILPLIVIIQWDFCFEVKCGRVWWPILGICALHLTHPKCTHTVVNTHTHTHTHTAVNTHPEQWAANAAAPGEHLGVRCLAQGSQTKSRRTEKRLQDASRNLPSKLPEKLCSSAPRAKIALNAKDGHTRCWFNLINRS